MKLIDVLQPDPLNAVREIASCEKVLSSSLHGLIVADALAIPNRHVAFSSLGQKPAEYLFKFEDYYSAFDDYRDRPLERSEIERDPLLVLNRLRAASESDIAALRQDLRTSFPFPKTAMTS